jgi:hypothetical protein
VLIVTEFFRKAIILSMFVYGDCMAVCSIFFFINHKAGGERSFLLTDRLRRRQGRRERERDRRER